MGGHSASDAGQNPLIKALVTGPAVLAEMLTGGLFMENVKIEKQRTSHNYFVIMRRVANQGLVEGFWAGFLPWGFTLGMCKGVVLGGARSFFLNFFTDTVGMTPGQSDIASGFCAGGVQGVFMSPILLARTRVLQDLEARSLKGNKLSVGQAVTESFKILNRGIKDDGFGMIFTGMPQMIFKRVMDWGSRFVLMKYVGEYFKSLHIDPEEKLSTLEEFGASFIGGGMSVCLTMPIDRMMPILQAARKEKKPIFTIMRELYAREGLSTLQRGFVMRFIHCGWHTTWAIFIANQITKSIQRKWSV